MTRLQGIYFNDLGRKIIVRYIFQHLRELRYPFYSSLLTELTTSNALNIIIKKRCDTDKHYYFT